MKAENKRAAHCFFGYVSFVLILLLAASALFALFLFLSGKFPSFLYASAPVSASSSEITVILDAGHGGEDGGAVGTIDGKEIYEKDLNLSICLMLRDLLEANGVNVVMTRTEDVLLYDRNTDYQGRKKVLDLAARLHIGQSIENAIFVSIHMNAFTQSKYSGLQVYYSPNHPGSSLLADDIQERVKEQLQRDNHRVTKAAGSEIQLLEKLTCPAVLVECGFLSNPQECQMLTDRHYQQKIAFLLFCSICEAMQEALERAPTSTQSDRISVDASKSVFEHKMAREYLIFDKKSFIMEKDS